MSCINRYCEYPNSNCNIDDEFAGGFDAEDFYFIHEMNSCQRIKEDEIDL